RFSDRHRQSDGRRVRYLGAHHVAASRRAVESRELRGIRQRGRGRGRPAVRASLDVAEPRVVRASRRRSHARRIGRARPAAAAPRRRVSRRARPLPDTGTGRSHGTTSGPTLLDLSARTVTSARQLPLSRLGHLVPPLVDNAALVALVAVTNDPPWAAKAAWDIARIAARDGRRVALVDLCLENPALHEMVGLHATEGIVDAFEYGVSLNKAAHEVTGVFIIPAGSETANPAQVYAHPRWPKLQAGFRSEGALLLALLPLTGLAQFSAAPDGALVLAPEGVGPEFGLPHDVPLLGVVRDRWLPSGPRVAAPAMTVAVADERRPGLRLALAGLVVAALAVGGWALLARARESLVAPPAPPPAPTTSTTSTNLHQPPPRPVAVPHDTLGWTIQLAAYASLDKALAHAD